MSEQKPSTEDVEDAYASTWMNHLNEHAREAFRRWLDSVRQEAYYHGEQAALMRAEGYLWKMRERSAERHRRERAENE